ncbi:MAG: cobalamin B12-binding domain-containing protein [Bacteroidales bacterium]|nr:cobalamin B12-binding domain-containing protein [Bacteroidales bacterium]
MDPNTRHHMERYTLNDLERLTGIKSDTIRIWERRYGILKPELTETGRRWYTGESLLRLINISLLYRNGSKISVVATLPDAEIAERVAHIKNSELENDETISSLLLSMNKMDERSVNEILLKSIVSRGVEHVFEQVVFPFLERVGIMWHTGSVSIATEHFITGVFRKRLLAASDSVFHNNSADESKFMLFLPEGELHELGLLYCEYLVARAGHSVLYLGQATPLKAIREAVQKWKPDFAITSTLSGLGIDDPLAYLRELRASTGATTILVAGGMSVLAEEAYPPGVHPLKSFNDLKVLLKDISLKVG